jgi:DNA-directed RNA polymerase specialized sigma24 family protein
MARLTGLLQEDGARIGGVLRQWAIYVFMVCSNWRALERRLIVGTNRGDLYPDMLPLSCHRYDLEGVFTPMDASTTLKKKWELTPEAFHKLLVALDHDLEKAAERYESIRRKLITFFENRGCLIPEELIDETFDRVTRRLAEGAIITARNPDSYCYGVARHVLQEYWKASPPPPLPPSPADDEPEIDCQEQCIKALPPETRDLLMQYYQAEDGVKHKEQRALLAQRLGMTMTALRLRILRIRDGLDDCVRQCLTQQPGA